MTMGDSLDNMEQRASLARLPVWQTLLTVAVVTALALLGLSRRFYVEALVDAFFGLALAGLVIVHLRVQPKWLDALAVLAGTGILSLLGFGVLHYQPHVIAVFSFLGLSSFAILVARTIWAKDRRILLYAWIPAGLLVASDYFASDLLAWTGRAHPKTLDLYLLFFDGSLGNQIAFTVGRYYAGYSWFHSFALIAYVGLAIPVTMVYAGRLVRFGRSAISSVSAFLITGPIGILFYNLFPACGPRHLVGSGFPFEPFPYADLHRLFLEAVPIAGPRNAIPSLHMAWTLLAWWYSKGLSRVERLIAFLFLAFTVAATMGTGEHWFVDLVVAFPFALMIQAIAAYELPVTHPERLGAALIGLGGTLGWLALLRYGAKLTGSSPWVPWILCAGTVLTICWRQARLARSTASTSVSAWAATKAPAAMAMADLGG